MRKLLPLLTLLSCPFSAQAAVQSATIQAAELAAHINAVEEAGQTVRFVLPAASHSWSECPVYGCYPLEPGGPEICIDPPEPPQPCPTFSEVLTYTVIFE